MLWAKNATAASINFQVKINAASSILFQYQQLAGAVDVSVSGGASIGLTGYCDGDYYSQTASSVQTPGSTWGKSVIFNTLNTRPSTNTLFTWAPAAFPTPANDTCTNAVNIAFNPGSPTVLTDQTLVMTRQATTPSPGYATGWNAQTRSNDVWYTLTKPVGITSFQLLLAIPAPRDFPPQ